MISHVNSAGFSRNALKKREEEVKRRMKRKANRGEDGGGRERDSETQKARSGREVGREGGPEGTDWLPMHTMCELPRRETATATRLAGGQANGRERKKEAGEAGFRQSAYRGGGGVPYNIIQTQRCCVP